MRSITFDKWDAGIDLRKGQSVSDANRLRDLLNCDVTNGLALRKRPGLCFVKDLPTNSVGLFVLDKQLRTVTQDSLRSDAPPTKLYKSLVVSGYLYAAVEIKNIIVHYWFNGSQQKVDAAQTALNTANTNYTNTFNALQGYLDNDLSKIISSQLLSDIGNAKTLAANIKAKADKLEISKWSTLKDAVAAADDLRITAIQCKTLLSNILKQSFIDNFGIKLNTLVLTIDSARTKIDLIDSLSSQGNSSIIQLLDAYKNILDNDSLSEQERISNVTSSIATLKSSIQPGQSLNDIARNMALAGVELVNSLPNINLIETAYNNYIAAVASKDSAKALLLKEQEALRGIITDSLCPNSKQIVTLAGKVFAPSADNAAVRFSATNNPRDWSTADDAGFLPISHHGGGRVTALAVYRGNLAVFTDVNVQIWHVDPDPAQHYLVDIAHGIGSEYPFSITSVSGDTLFLSASGARSLSQQSVSGNLADLDIGSPVDLLVKDMLRRNIAAQVLGHYSQPMGKFLLFIGEEVLVYSFSKTSKVAAWSRWVLPGIVDSVVDMLGITYVRINNQLFKFDDATYADNNVTFPVLIDMAFLSLKAPGVLKRLVGMDAVTDGNCDLFIACDESNPNEEFYVANLEGDSRPFGTIPVELHGTAFSFRFKSNNAHELQLNLMSFYYDTMGVR